MGERASISELKSTRNLKCDKKQKCSKKVKFLTDDNSMIKLVDGIHEKVPAKDARPFGKVQGDSDVRVKDDSSKMEKALPSWNGVLRKCSANPNKILCAFCQSSEDSEASGNMVHYLKGKPVSADYNGGLNVIHAHRNCTEWSPNVYFKDDYAINLEGEVARSRRIKCCCCDIKGAALGCYEKSCRKSFHVPCAKLTPECRWDNENFVMLCPLHVTFKLPNETPKSQLKQTKKYIPKRQSQIQNQEIVVEREINTCLRWNSPGTTQKLVLCCSALTSAEKETVSQFERLSGVMVLKNWDSRVTQVIASTDEKAACRRTLKFLMGILEGKWILSIEWVHACLKAMEIIAEQQYEIDGDIHGIRDGPRLGRLRLLNKQPKLFNGCKFYFCGDFVPSYKGYLHDLVVAAGGTVLNRKPVSRDHEAPSSGCFTVTTFIIYSLEVPEKCNPSKRNLVFDRRRSDAEALASSCKAAVATNSWILNSIAGSKLQNLLD